MVRATGVAKKMKQRADKRDDKAIAPEREYGRRSTTPRSAARRSIATSSTPSGPLGPARKPSGKAASAMPGPARKPASAAKRPAASSRKGASSKKRSGK